MPWKVGGDYAYRVRGRSPTWAAGDMADLQHAVRATDNKDAMGGKIRKSSANTRSRSTISPSSDDAARHVPHPLAEAFGRKAVPWKKSSPPQAS